MGREALPGTSGGTQQLSQKQLVRRMEDNRDDLAAWQWKPRKLVSAPFSRLRSGRVRCHPLPTATHFAARLSLAAARSAASRAAASATKAALKHGLIAAPRQVIPKAIKWGPQVARRAVINQVTQTIGRAARRGAGRAGATSGRVVGTAGQRS
jgi:ribosomal protein L18